ncbi:hypothetical protein PAXRUDRAFT_149051, partial [Paxillus rubicundulus Ve08.2h10]
VSISTDSINLAVQHLSVKLQNALNHLSQSCLASYTYNNFDVDLKSQVHMAETMNDSLKHLTLWLLFLLIHDILIDDLKCSEDLWHKSALC